MSLCGIAINPPRYEEPQKSMMHLLVHAPVTGVLNNTDFLNEIKTHPVRVRRNKGSDLYSLLVGVLKMLIVLQTPRALIPVICG